jgi:murein tripeptide amidase MpaA
MWLKSGERGLQFGVATFCERLDFDWENWKRKKKFGEKAVNFVFFALNLYFLVRLL